MRVLVFSRARRDIAAAVTWWRANRPSAPGLLEAELGAELNQLESQPFSAPRARDAGLRHYHRWPLVNTRYHLYYRVNEAKQQLEILRLWHMSRRRPKVL